MRTSVTVCDVCQEIGKPTTAYRITSEGRAVSTDLCSRHNGPLEAVLDRTAPGVPEEPAPRRGRRSRLTVTTMDEIEQRKRQPGDGESAPPSE